MTDQEITEKLAEIAGLEHLKRGEGNNPYAHDVYWNPKGTCFVFPWHFQPLQDWNHLMMVVEIMRKKGFAYKAWDTDGYHHFWLWKKYLGANEEEHKFPHMAHDQDPRRAIALAIIEARGLWVVGGEKR